MAEPHQHLPFDALNVNIQALLHNNQAILHGLTKLRLSCAENTLLLRQILDLLPDSTNPTQPPDEPTVFDGMPTLTITKTEDTVDTEPVISSSVDTELVQETTALLPDLGLVLDDAIDFRCGNPNVWGSFTVYESVKVSIDSVVQPTKSYVEDKTVGSPEPLPNELRSGYSFIDCKYPALPNSFDTSRVPCPAMNCYCIVYLLPCDVFDFGSISLVDDPYGFRLLLMGGVAHDDYMVRSNLGQKLDVYEDLVESTSIWQVFDQNPKRTTSDSILFRNVSSYECWQTTDFFPSKLFDPSISKLILTAHRFIEHRFLVAFVPNDAGIFMKNGIKFLLNEAEQKPTLLLGTCIVDFTEKCHGVRSPTNQLMNVYYGDSVGEYVARVTPIYFDPGGRYVSSELLTGVTINVGEAKFYLHKFPLLSKRNFLQKLVSKANEENCDEITIGDFPGGPTAFEICATFCYGMPVTLNAYNVVAVRCAAEYLEMTEDIDQGNLIFKIAVFLNSSIFRSWMDSIIVLPTAKSLLPWSEDLKNVGRCIDCIASTTSVDPANIAWSYTYNRNLSVFDRNAADGMKLSQRIQSVPKDWWVENVSELEIDVYKRVILAVKSKGRMDSTVIGEALETYAVRWLPELYDGLVADTRSWRYKYIVETLVCLLPSDTHFGCTCGFLLKLLRFAILVGVADTLRENLVDRISVKLHEASVKDLLIPAQWPQSTLYDVELVQCFVNRNVMHEKYVQCLTIENSEETEDFISGPERGSLLDVDRYPQLLHPRVTRFVLFACIKSPLCFVRPSIDTCYAYGSSSLRTRMFSRGR